MREFVIFAVLTAAVWANPLEYDMPEPGELALMLNEDDFEDYLDRWLEFQGSKAMLSVTTAVSSGCQIRINGDLGQPQPVYIHKNNYMSPTGNTGLVDLPANDEVIIACTGSGRTILHPQITSSGAVATARCVSGNLVAGTGWLNGNGTFGGLTCSSHAYHTAEATSTKCFGDNIVIRVGFTVNNVFYPTYWSCFDQNRLEVLYVWYSQDPTNAVYQTGVDRPSWLAGSFFPGVSINQLYTQVSQKSVIAGLVGEEMANKYITNTQFLARGHLTAKTDFIYATGQRASFYFINAAPQWQPFNAGNWNWLEQNLRTRIGQAGYNATIYSGTFGVTQLRDGNGRLVDIYLHRSGNTNQVPVPLYFYKVAYDANRRLGTAFVSINNPYYTTAEVSALQFCTDRCRNNSAFNWIGWQPDRIDLGFSFCCTIDEFRKIIQHLPAFTVNGLLT